MRTEPPEQGHKKTAKLTGAETAYGIRGDLKLRAQIAPTLRLRQDTFFIIIFIDTRNKYTYVYFMSRQQTYQWDEAKRASNLRKHQVDFALIEKFDWDSALTREDTRQDYHEARYVSVGLIDARLYVAVWTARGNACRLISLRKANDREVKFYERS
jgi:uncharacterized protein